MKGTYLSWGIVQSLCYVWKIISQMQYLWMQLQVQNYQGKPSTMLPSPSRGNWYSVGRCWSMLGEEWTVEAGGKGSSTGVCALPFINVWGVCVYSGTWTCDWELRFRALGHVKVYLVTWACLSYKPEQLQSTERLSVITSHHKTQTLPHF